MKSQLFQNNKAPVSLVLMICVSCTLMVMVLLGIVFYRYKKKETARKNHFLGDKELCTQWLNNSSYYKYESNPISFPFPKIEKGLLNRGHFLGIVKEIFCIT